MKTAKDMFEKLGYSPKYQFKNINSLTEMRKNGYFNGVNRDATIEEIIAKSEVVG